MFTIINIDNFLNRITMYRLALYCLIFLWLAGFLSSFFGILPFAPQDLIFSSAVIIIASAAINAALSYLFKAPSNTESTYITALILALIIGPEKSLSGFLPLIIVSALAITSKYIVAINKKHVFNPVAFAIVFAPYLFYYYPSWWISSPYLAPWVLLIGFLIVRKLQRTDLVASFLLVYLAVSLGASTLNLENIIFQIKNIVAYSPILFFTFVMLVEPATTPSTRLLRMLYGSLVAFLLAPFIHIGSLYFSLESALLIGNIFSFLVSSKRKWILTLRRKEIVSHNTVNFAFDAAKKISFKPGQYLEWTLPHHPQDARGMRRYFTIASSPTEKQMMLGVKFYEKPSSYKKTLASLNLGEKVTAAQLAGEFIMPNDKSKKLVFLAGGIGITPFRSMIKYLLDIKEKRDIILLYANKSVHDIAYKEVFDQAEKELGIQVAYILEKASENSPYFNVRQGIINKDFIMEKVPDFKERIFYISGPKSMIDSFKKTLKEIGAQKHHIKTDFFPGYT
ncbi:MAG: hypothetical protein A3A98_02560 [Candidatus Staskawiczbacteria bacterium RIFCSPLOWO2_01_FULL_40_39]|uniref:FAD-binding FR-type domain-containing protein n=1 Tax=Candidatus Staskawiczbacteria bacterium RIFCSPHIGHO2_01_FULL_39_25 TaxID=1802202 RepID=A0A1G2HPR5_9BACT|nr:MAG: hypothetical protein A2730_02285 [Candidatus Staskawiczbacteria bacterium RIFCSPHIGHO2_01_FULL_39_25]OGZ73631.1 MAG: hypothetical protein A3A98_02560 [Candidatus Staskawiczbacteria bacterium RIFCSPLOWO2_01_FULL_40_39]OGZ74618.1 MAG: hypothetical protein A3I87_01635 [Candidatus Staskawiczbacteria bacterium RIFCSPLOWO2_02_FULL_39_8]